jgi:hypothetical protein
MLNPALYLERALIDTQKNINKKSPKIKKSW